MASEHPKVAVVMPTWKRGDLLRACLESLRRQTFRDFQTIVVANGAGNWAEELAREFGCKLVRLSSNRGFAAGVNAGIAASQSECVAILNDDVELRPDWLAQLVELLDQRADLSFCCGKILQRDGKTIDNAGDALSLGGGAWRLGYGRPDGPDFDQPRELFAISGTAALFRRSVFDELGGFDEGFISYLEDVDFSIRMWRAGLRGMYWPRAVALHHGGASSGGPEQSAAFELVSRNIPLLVAKHYPLLRLLPQVRWSHLLRLGMAVRKGLLAAHFSGVRRGLRQWPSTIARRESWTQEQKRHFLEWLRASDLAIYEDIVARPREQQDTYWRMYFLLFRPARPAVAANRSPELGAKTTPNADPSLRSG